MLRRVHQLLGAQRPQLLQRAHQSLQVVGAERGEALEPLEHLDDGGEVAPRGFDRGLAGRLHLAVLVMLGLPVVVARPVLQGGDVHADLHRFGPRQVLAARHDAVEELGTEPVQKL